MLDSIPTLGGSNVATLEAVDPVIYKRLVDSVVGYAIYIIDPDGLVASWNAGAERAMLFTSDEIIGEHFSCFYTGADQAADLPFKALGIARQAGVYESAGWRVRKDGTRFWADVVIEPLYDSKGMLLGFTQIARDCTAQHQDCLAALERERQYRYLVQSVTDYAVYMLDLDGLIVNWNSGAAKFKGYTAEQIVGQHFSCFYTLEDQAVGAPAIAITVARKTGRYEAEGWRVRRDGTCFWAQVVIDLVRDDSGTAIGFAKITRDRTEQRQAQAEIHESERRFRHLVQGVTDYAIYMLDGKGMVTNWNLGAARAKGYTAAEVVGQHFSRFFTLEDQARDLPSRSLSAALRDGQFETEGWRVRKDGGQFWAHVVIDVIRDDEGELVGFAKITRDITSQKADADRLMNVTRTLDLALSNMKHGLCVFDQAETLQLANQRFIEMFQPIYERSLIGLSFKELVHLVVGGHTKDGQAVVEEALCCRHRGLIKRGCRDITIEDLPGGMSVAISHATLPDGSWVSTFEDVTASRQAQVTIAKLASTDSLTGLANRRAFNERIAAMILDRARPRSIALMLIDLDDFKAANDTYGHGYGDRILQHVAAAMQAHLRTGDLAARLGGDEFAVVLQDCPAHEAIVVAKRLISCIRMPPPRSDIVTTQNISIGIVIASASDCEADVLLHNADVALYEAKANGKGSFRVYTHEMSARIRAERQLEQDLAAAITEVDGRDCGLAVHYQPILDMTEGCIVGREALLRWTHPHRGPIPSSVFIPLAERTGLIHRLGSWLLGRACADAATWADGARVAINVSTFQLGAGALVREVASVLASMELPAERLEIEITESVFIDDAPKKLKELNDIKSLGVSVALDDFGTGFSSLTLLRSFQFDRIKLDGSFVRDAIGRADCAGIVAVVAELGRRLAIKVVAEGVETVEQFELVRSHGCHEVQGHLIGRPTELTSAMIKGLPC